MGRTQRKRGANRKTGGTENEPASKIKPQWCILHTVKQTFIQGPFIALENVADPVQRLKKLHEIRDLRLAAPPTSSMRMDDVCKQIPNSIEDCDLTVTGYHRGCYQHFCKNLDRLKTMDESEVQHHRSPRKSGSSGILFGPECIFCGKKGPIHVKVRNTRSTERTIKFSLTESWQRIAMIAEEKGNSSLLRKIKGIDLLAAEAQFHPKCRKMFEVLDDRGLSQEKETVSRQANMMDAHNLAFMAVLDFVKDRIIVHQEVIPLTSLRLIYTAKLDETSFGNPNYRAEKLMRRLESHPEIGRNLVFNKVEPDERGSLPFYLVHSTSLTVNDAVRQVYKLTSKDCMKDVALLLRGIICRAFRERKALPWPPTAADLTVSKDIIPEELHRFLSYVISSNPDTECEKTKRLILSIGQDLCRSVSNSEWKLPKHILLCMTIRHMYRSKQLTTLLNRLGNCESYEFGIELTTALAQALDESCTLLTPQIARGEGSILFHSEWDNYNQVLTSIHGKSFVNSAAGIMIQETKSDMDLPEVRTLPTTTKTKERSLQSTVQPYLPPFHISKRTGPVMPDGTSAPSQANEERWQLALHIYHIWILCRQICCSGKQIFPALGGFISATGKPPERKSTIDYYPCINEPITEYSTVKELLRMSEEATRKVGQTYTITTFDLGVCMKALPLIWSDAERYKTHIILIGAFHIILNYLNMIGHKMSGSGYSEILLESALVTSGCLRGVLTGKAYAKAMYCLKATSEAMERLLLQQFIEETHTDISDISAIITLLQSCDRENLRKATVDPMINDFLEGYFDFQAQVQGGRLGKTAAFWLSFIKHARLVFMLLYAIKTNDFRLFHKCISQMAGLFFAFGGQNYARYLTWFDCYLTNIEATHPDKCKKCTNTFEYKGHRYWDS